MNMDLSEEYKAGWRAACAHLHDTFHEAVAFYVGQPEFDRVRGTYERVAEQAIQAAEQPVAGLVVIDSTQRPNHCATGLCRYAPDRLVIGEWYCASCADLIESRPWHRSRGRTRPNINATYVLLESSGDPAPSPGEEINSAAVIFGHPNQVVAYRYVAPDGHVMVLDPADVTVILADEPNQPRTPDTTGSGS